MISAPLAFRALRRWCEPEILLDREVRAGRYSGPNPKGENCPRLIGIAFKTRKSFAIPAPGWLL